MSRERAKRTEAFIGDLVGFLRVRGAHDETCREAAAALVRLEGERDEARMIRERDRWLACASCERVIAGASAERDALRERVAELERDAESYRLQIAVLRETGANGPLADDIERWRVECSSLEAVRLRERVAELEGWDVRGFAAGLAECGGAMAHEDGWVLMSIAEAESRRERVRVAEQKLEAAVEANRTALAVTRQSRERVALLEAFIVKLRDLVRVPVQPHGVWQIPATKELLDEWFALAPDGAEEK